ncbi:D-alanyl-D-alanine carboxypeptidase family protein [Cohnella zeiphila]|uniref:D-alanyl-D-alanine carboxypeptidase n=1 Tax=Cohnella zeiphila TaxID=2761120 RepID=A0A7X0VYX2_9BACL|nr:D-alanyl-D-alanine carboxypeptidase family protein [Cohnella zeiphila]MBB6735819.1 D-alanyl-D-alanine carboxypeptidase [Cohnella zeiphila]
MIRIKTSIRNRRPAGPLWFRWGICAAIAPALALGGWTSPAASAVVTVPSPSAASPSPDSGSAAVSAPEPIRHPPLAGKQPSTHARADALIDVASGRLLAGHNGDKEMKIASLTKIMTAIVAIENGRLNDTVTVSKNAAGKEGSSLYLRLGEKIKLENLLYGLMLRSGNDAATAIAEHVGGSLEGFVYLMNRKSEELGLTHTHFANPHGLDQPEHYSSANDLAALTAYALHNDTFKTIVRTKFRKAPNPNDPWDYEWKNKNRMLTMYDGADGVKTGYTKQALRCLVSSATRGGQQLVAVTLNDGDDWQDHRKLLDYGFERFPLQLVVKKGEPVAGNPYVAAADFRYPFEAGERADLRVRVMPLASTDIAYAFGSRGTLSFRLGDNVIGRVGLVEAPGAVSPVAPGGSGGPASRTPVPEHRP